MATPEITQDELRALLRYEPKTGDFFYRNAEKGGVNKGDKAGYVNTSGYVVIQIKYTKIHGHRLAWFYERGEWPPHEIDHINRIRSDNRIENLRCVTRQQNAWNLSAHKGSRSGVLGVAWASRSGKWQVQMQVKGKSHYIGQFTNIDDAIAARIDAQKRLHIADPDIFGG